MLDPLKTALSDLLHLSKDALHVHLGIGIYLVATLLLRRPLGSWLPWLIVLALELINEALDLAHHLRRGGIEPAGLLDSVKDIINTMLWPTVLLIALRVGGAAGRRKADEAGH